MGLPSLLIKPYVKFSFVSFPVFFASSGGFSLRRNHGKRIASSSTVVAEFSFTREAESLPTANCFGNGLIVKEKLFFSRCINFLRILCLFCDSSAYISVHLRLQRR